MKEEIDKCGKIKLLLSLLSSSIDTSQLNEGREILNLINDVFEAIEYRTPETVTEYIRYPASISGSCLTFEICPRCNAALNRSYQEYCSTCGQRLRWIAPSKMKIKPRNDEA